MKSEFKIKGREASPAEYAQLMEALLASQAATPTARACAHDEAQGAPSLLDAFFAQADEVEAETKDGDHAVHHRVSGFLDAGSTISPVSAAPPWAAPGRFE